MAGNPRVVTEDVRFTWDGVSQRIPRGQVMDVTPGSALEAAIGLDRLRPLGAVAAQPPAEEAEPEQEPETPPAKPKAAPKKQDDEARDGDA